MFKVIIIRTEKHSFSISIDTKKIDLKLLKEKFINLGEYKLSEPINLKDNFINNEIIEDIIII